jgi:hypothetical protein
MDSIDSQRTGVRVTPRVPGSHPLHQLYPNLSGAILSEADLSGVNLSGANLSGANLSGPADVSGANLDAANLSGVNLSGANLRRANLSRAYLSPAHLPADLSGADLSAANLSGVNLSGAWLWSANLSGANLSGASLQGAQLSETDFSGADLTGCRVYGVSAWNLKLVGAKQQNLVITREDDPEITVDNVEVAQFIHLMLHNEKIRDVIDTITSKVVLILGASPLSVRQSSMLYVRNCASATTYRCPHGPLHHCRPD